MTAVWRKQYHHYLCYILLLQHVFGYQTINPAIFFLQGRTRGRGGGAHSVGFLFFVLGLVLSFCFIGGFFCLSLSPLKILIEVSIPPYIQHKQHLELHSIASYEMLTDVTPCKDCLWSKCMKRKLFFDVRRKPQIIYFSSCFWRIFSYLKTVKIIR